MAFAHYKVVAELSCALVPDHRHLHQAHGRENVAHNDATKSCLFEIFKCQCEPH